MLKYYLLIKMILISLFKNYYLSTIVNDKRLCGYDYISNIIRADKRINDINNSVLNPACIGIVAGWTHYEYMWVWYKVIYIMHMMHKTMIVYPVDHAYSRGCKAEYAYARKLNMNRLIVYSIHNLNHREGI